MFYVYASIVSGIVNALAVGIMIPLKKLMEFLFLLPILKYLLTLLDYYNVLSPEALIIHSALGLSGCLWPSWASYQLCYFSPGPPTL